MVAAASLMVALDTLVVSTALTTIKGDLGASVEELEWTINAYNLTLVVLLLPAAALGDRFGRRRVFATGLGVFIAASAACAVSPSVEALIAARAVQGAGGALVGTLPYALVSAAFPPERQGAAIGTLGGIAGLALIGGPVLGGAIAAGIAWQWIFWLNVPIGLVVLPLVLNRVEESFGPDTALDVAGLALVVGAALGVTWALVRGNDAGWASLEVVGSMTVGTTLAAGFVAWELRIRQPMLPMRRLEHGLPLVVIALGGSMAIPPAATAVLRSMPASAVGKASGAKSMLRELGGVFGPAVAVAVSASVGSYASPTAFTNVLAPALGVACGFALVGMIAGGVVPGREASKTMAEPSSSLPAPDDHVSPTPRSAS